MIAAELGLAAPAFDISSACSSFAVQLHQLRMMRPEALPDYILVVNAENTTRTVDYSDRRTAVLWGDATSAAVVSTRKPSRFVMRVELGRERSLGLGQGRDSDGRALHAERPRGAGVRDSQVARRARACFAERAARPADLYFIGHQANRLMLEAVATRAEIRADRHLFNVDEYGNCGAAGAPSVLSQNWERFRSGDEIALVVVGSGLTWGGMLISVEGTA